MERKQNGVTKKMKARIKFSKVGSMRFIGHLDLMRFFQKAFRRAKIAISYSQGYSPHQLMSFASPLGIGLSSDAEYLDIVLDDTQGIQGIVEQINEAMNDEICVKEFTVLKEEAKTSMAVLAACDYVVALKKGKDNFLQDKECCKKAVENLAKKDKIEIVKKTKRSEKLVDIRNNIYCIKTDPKEFEAFTKVSYGKSELDTEEYDPLFYCELTAGSIVNIKPELVLEALCREEGQEFNVLDYQIHRIEMYADRNGKKGEIHTFATDVKCDLVPLSEYEAK